MDKVARIILTVLLAASTLSAQAATLKQGDTPPDYLGLKIGNEKITLSAYQGKAVVLTFWATWCTYCLKELPILENLQRKASNRLQVIAVNTEERDKFRAVARHLKDFQLQLGYDPEEVAADAYGVNGIPHLVIIGRDGKVQAVFRGYAETDLPQIVADINVAIGANSKASSASAAPADSGK